MVVKSRKRLLREAPDRAILRLAGALARQAAREVHAREWPPTGRTGTPAAARKSSTGYTRNAIVRNCVLDPDTYFSQKPVTFAGPSPKNTHCSRQLNGIVAK